MFPDDLPSLLDQGMNGADRLRFSRYLHSGQGSDRPQPRPEPATNGLGHALHQVQLLAVWHHVNDPEPATGPKLNGARIMARAMIEWAEREPRDTARTRRRKRPQDERYDRDPLPATEAERGLDRHY
jgi:hypothetical protein